MVSFFWQRAFKKLAGLHCTCRYHVQKLQAAVGQSHSNCIRMAASHIQIVVATSRIQIVPSWPPVACNMNKIDGKLPGTGGHAGTVCVRLVATWVLF